MVGLLCVHLWKYVRGMSGLTRPEILQIGPPPPVTRVPCMVYPKDLLTGSKGRVVITRLDRGVLE